MAKVNFYFRSVVVGVMTSITFLFLSDSLQAQDTVCAVVKIEIVQELTIERQAFEATLEIENTLADKKITDMNVDVKFQNEDGEAVLASSDPNNTTAKFFIRQNKLTGIENINGTGALDAGKTAKATWLIVPAPGSSDGLPAGKLYFVGATFEYKLDGVADKMEVAPDSIYVKPLPLLSLDYFLPRFVFADDPLTNEVEPIEPFTLGVRVQNNGKGVGKNIKIDSAQPKIVENKQGLLIDFKLLNSYVQDKPINNSLLIQFGDIPAGESRMGRWNMQTSLSGQFTAFSAEYSHEDDLGGQLTSILEEVNTHTLLHDVLVDLPGRDSVKDFLAYDSFDSLSNTVNGLKVYESNSTTSSVTDFTQSATFVAANGAYNISMGANAGFVYAQFDDPFFGKKSIASVIRSDGKVLNKNNAWLSKKYNKSSKSNSYHLNVFDAATTGKYTISFRDKVLVPRSPEIQFIALKTTHVGKPLSFIIKASDPDGTTPTLTVSGAPQGVQFVDKKDGTGTFTWTPQQNQVGRHVFQLYASDGVLSTKRDIVIVVNSAVDTDGDGMLDSWELEKFGNLDKDGSGDSDGDGVSDLEEFERETDPTVTDGPQSPKILAPNKEDFVASKTPELIIENSKYVGSFPVVYAFEVFSDKAHSKLVDAYYSHPQNKTSSETTWKPKKLQEDAFYYWRVRAFDSFTYSPWVYGSFRVNSENTLPNAPTLNYPKQEQTVYAQQLKLVVNASEDIDGDDLSYTFYLYDDKAQNTLLSKSAKLSANTSGQVEWPIVQNLKEGKKYFWRAEVTDVAGRPISSQVFTFFLGVSNTPPKPPKIIKPVNSERVGVSTPVLVIQDAIDLNEQDTLSYLFEVSTSAEFASSHPDFYSSGWLVDSADQDTFSWKIKQSLKEDTNYFWRVKARDLQNAESAWSSSSFRVNAENQPPSVPAIRNPGDKAQVITLTPKIAVFSSKDGDLDQVSYEFEIYLDAQKTKLLLSKNSKQPELVLDKLEDDKWYFWRARAKDEKGKYSAWTKLHQFFVNENNFDNEPEFVWLAPEGGTDIIEGKSIYLRWEDADPDSSALISLYFADNPQGNNKKRIAHNISEDKDGEFDKIEWSSRGLQSGNYYFFAVIEDASNAVSVAAENVFIIKVKKQKPHPLYVQSVSGDGIPYTLNNLIDHRYYTKWYHWSFGNSNLLFDFGEVKRLDKVKISFGRHRLIRYMYSIEVSTDGANWTRVVNYKKSRRRFWSKSGQFSQTQARYVRLIIHESYFEWRGWWFSTIFPVSIRTIREVVFKGGSY